MKYTIAILLLLIISISHGQSHDFELIGNSDTTSLLIAPNKPFGSNLSGFSQIVLAGDILDTFGFKPSLNFMKLTFDGTTNKFRIMGDNAEESHLEINMNGGIILNGRTNLNRFKKFKHRSLPLLVDQNGTIQEDTRTRYHAINGFSFIENDANLSQNGEISTNFGKLRAPLQLPDGVILDSLIAVFNDKSDNDDLYCSLMRLSKGFTEWNDIGLEVTTVNSLGTNSGYQTKKKKIYNHDKVDNRRFDYYILLRPKDDINWKGTIRLLRCIIAYKV